MQAKNAGNSAMSGSPAIEMRNWIGEAVDARRSVGRGEAVRQVSRELRIPPRRIRAILGGEIGRVWADEWKAAQEWHADFCARQADKLAHEAELYRMRAAALKERTR